MKKSMIKLKIAQLPLEPGVYFFRGEKGEILYIGKATNLRSRVQSYFRGDVAVSRSEWISLMVSQVKDIDFERTDSVLEALILESNLIKKHQPKYNTLEKDDKSFSYFVVTKEDFPKVLIVRKTDLEVVERKTPNAKREMQKIKGKKVSRFAFDVSRAYGPYTSKLQMQTALKIMRRIFPFHALKQKTEKGCLDFQLGLCPGPYADAISKADYQKNIRGIKMILEGKKKSLVKTLEKEMLAASKKEEFEKAGQLKSKIYALNHIRDVALMTRDFEESSHNVERITQNVKDVDAPYSTLHAMRIEAYDISNIGGEHAVGSMVVFEGNQANKSQYRKFKIKTVEGANDVAMMREVLLRRFRHDWPMPELVLLDGGQGHVNMAAKLLHQELGLAVTIVGVAKGPTRKKLDLKFAATADKKNGPEILKILRDENLLKNIMDQAHRFAVTFHRQVRSKNALK